MDLNNHIKYIFMDLNNHIKYMSNYKHDFFIIGGNLLQATIE